MSILRGWFLFLAVAGLAPGPLFAAGPDINPGMWIVELEDEPSVSFRGGVPESLTRAGNGAAKALEATAPAATGADRLMVSDPAVQRYAAHLDQARAEVLDRASNRLGRTLVPTYVYRHLRNGFAIRMSEAEASLLSELPGVRSVQPDIIETLHTDAGPEWVGAPGAWAGSVGVPGTRGENTVLGVIDSGVNWASIFFDPTETSLPIDNPRPGFLGLCADGTLNICNDKLIGVYDFTEENTDGFDPDGHGSHTASTAVGVPLSFSLNFGSGPIGFQVSGIAPRASFISYKACQAPPDSPTGQFECPGSATSAALEQAISDGVDAINYSIGGPPIDPWGPQGNQRLFLNLREAGIVPVTSAGNSGPIDGTVGSPANVPWAVAVANAHHGRIIANRVVDTVGGNFDIGELVGESVAGGTTILPIVHASDFGNALCGTGPAELGPSCADNTGATNPFEPGTFDGEIVVCDRGTYGRIEKGKNVLEAGAGGMILANTSAQGDSVQRDEHCLPATHIDSEQGDRLRDWLSSGNGHAGRLTGTQRYVDPSLSGEINNSSSRGPAGDAPGLMKPNVTAPGTSVLAAVTEINATEDGPGANAANQVGFLTGTSMSSPHVAGAALLVRSAHPDWSVDAVISALETTSDAGRVRNAGDTPTRIVDRGAGGIRVDEAMRAGLYLPVTENEFLAADPSGGGDPSELNLPGLVDERCVVTCSFTRTVRALEAGAWEAAGEGDPIITVTPSSFSLSAGEEQELTIDVVRGAASVGDWDAGSVVLAPTFGDFSIQRLPLGVTLSASSLRVINSDTNRGRDSIGIDDLVPVDELVFRTSALVRPEQREASLPEDPTPDFPFDSNAGTETVLVEVPEDAMLLHAETFDSGAADIDLFVGRDLNGDGQAQSGEAVCESISPDDTERCVIETPDAGTWWVRVQNWTAIGTGENAVPYEFAVFKEERDPSLVAVAPGAHDGGPLSVPIYWDQPAMARTERWLGVVAASSSPTVLADLGLFPLAIRRTGANTPADVALFNDATYSTVIPGSTTHDRMFIDVPPDAARLEISVEGAVSGVTLRRRGFDELAATVPATPPAPDPVLIEAEVSGDAFVAELVDSGDSPIEAGRYYVVIENDFPSEQAAEVTATVTMAEAGPTPELQNYPRRGLWGPVSRSINQGIDFQLGGGGRFVVWYTYDEAGLPTFYITDTVDFDPGNPFFDAVLFRPTSNDVRATLKVVGEAQFTAVAEDRIMFAWRLNGNHGAEMHDPATNTTCPTIDGDSVPLLGHWVSRTTSAGGATVLITDSAEAWIRYYYDNLNRPRWVLADEELPATLPGGNLMEVLEYRGFCAYCAVQPVTNEVIGTLERQFIDADTAREVSNFVAGPPINASVDIDREIELTSFPAPCANP